MMRALYSGVSGLRNHQTKMDVIGNNIANVNTTGFKAGRVNFQDMLSQTLQGAGAAQGNLGGTNPMQVGLGMSVASIDTIFTDGSTQSTGVVDDLAISGDGLFVVDDGGKQYYTRAGDFKFDHYGNYVTDGGMKVMGYMADEDGNLGVSLVPIVKPSGKTIPQKQSTAAAVTGNLNSSAKNGEGATSSVEIYDSLGAAHKLTQTYYKVNQGGNTGANVWYCKTDVANATKGTAPTKPAVQYSKLVFDASGKLISTEDIDASGTATTQNVSMNNFKLSTSSDEQQLAFVQFDSQGAMHTFQMNFTYTDSSSSTGGYGTWSCNVKDATTQKSIGTFKVNYDTTNGYTFGTAVPPATPPTAPNPLTYTSEDGTTQTLNFSLASSVAPDATTTSGYFNYPTNSATITPPVPDSPITCDIAGAASMTVTVDRTKITQASDKGSSLTVDQDGYAMGTLSGYSFDSSGVLTGSFSNGQKRVLAQVALANFTNPGGLNKISDTLYEKSNNSGEPSIGTTGTGGRGTISPSSLEMSNVDLAQQFSDMIVTQRGYQANSKIITTTDTMLEELVNLKR